MTGLVLYSCEKWSSNQSAETGFGKSCAPLVGLEYTVLQVNKGLNQGAQTRKFDDRQKALWII